MAVSPRPDADAVPPRRGGVGHASQGGGEPSPGEDARPPGAILAGGAARRMGGGDKGLLALGGSTVLGYAIARLGPQVSRLALNANGDPARFADLGLPVLPDGLPGRPGPLAGVLAAMEWAAERGAKRVVTAAADTPFLPLDLVARLAAAGPGLVLAATPEGPSDGERGRGGAGRPARHPTFGLWPVALRHDLRAALEGGVRKVVEWTDRHGPACAVFPDEAAFFNVNTPEDLARAREMAR